MKHSHLGVHAIDHLSHTSRLRGWNAGFKTTLALGTLAVCLAADCPAVSAAVILSMAALLIGAGGVSLRDYVRLLRVPLFFLLVSGLAVACEIAPTPQGDWALALPWFAVCVSRPSLAYAGALSLKALGAVSAMYLLALSTPADELAGVLRRAHLPELLVELMYLIYRFLFILLDLHGRMREASAARLGDYGLRAQMRAFGWTVSSLLIRAVRKSSVYYDAMTARCYSGGLQFLEEEKPLRPGLCAAALAYWLALGVLWWGTR